MFHGGKKCGVSISLRRSRTGFTDSYAFKIHFIPFLHSYQSKAVVIQFSADGSGLYSCTFGYVSITFLYCNGMTGLEDITIHIDLGSCGFIYIIFTYGLKESEGDEFP